MTTLNTTDPIDLDDSCVAAYQVAVRSGGFVPENVAAELACGEDEALRIRAVLLRMRLLAPGLDDGVYLPADPEIAEGELSAELEAGITARRHRLTQIHERLRPLAPVYAEHRQHAHDAAAVRLIDDPAEVRRELNAAARHCARSVFTIQPGGARSPAALNQAVGRDVAMLERGVTMRILYQHTARANLTTRTYARRVTALGAEVRTTDEIHERLIIFDGSVAFVPQQRVAGRSPGAAVVTDPTVVGFLCHLHDRVWSAAQRYDPEDTEYSTTSVEIRHSILRLMATGLKDDVIARRLGMATRTCRRYMAGIMEELGATSRFQAGVRAAERGLLPREDAPRAPVRQQLGREHAGAARAGAAA
ncbi:helix-turn-helix transcriptional regulator [Pilimelia terevasa]|nr:helix-turn-helix transcriptional regulator [Pilimelia terevasa]